MKCNECKQDKVLHSPEVPLCEDCYYEMFKDDEPDFVLESTVADIKPSELIFTSPPTNSIILPNSYFVMPKAYKVKEQELTQSDLNSLLLALLHDVTFFDNHPTFDSIKHLLEEVK